MSQGACATTRSVRAGAKADLRDTWHVGAQDAEARGQAAEEEARQLEERVAETEEAVRSTTAMAEARAAAEKAARVKLDALSLSKTEAEARLAAAEDAVLRLETEAEELAHAVHAVEVVASTVSDKACDARLQTNALAARLAPPAPPRAPPLTSPAAAAEVQARSLDSTPGARPQIPTGGGSPDSGASFVETAATAPAGTGGALIDLPEGSPLGARASGLSLRSVRTVPALLFFMCCCAALDLATWGQVQGHSVLSCRA